MIIAQACKSICVAQQLTNFMSISVRLSNSGIQVALGEGDEKRLVPIADTPQDQPRRSYVYAHATREGRYFYIGKGIGNRAWSYDRHPLWRRYVEKHLNGEFSVLILLDNLSAEDAEEIESNWIAQESETLVNWISFGRKFDYPKLDQFHKLRNANRDLIAKGRITEKTDMESAVRSYLSAISSIDQYIDIDYEMGIVGQLLREERADTGRWGEHEAIDRLSLCLVKLGRVDEAALHVEDYFKRFPADTRLAASERILKRISKGLLKKRL